MLRSDHCTWVVLGQLWPAGIVCEGREAIQTLDLNHWFQRHSCLSMELLLIHALKCFIFSSWQSELHSYQNQISISVVHIIVQRFASFFKCLYTLTSPSWYFLPLRENKLTQTSPYTAQEWHRHQYSLARRVNITLKKKHSGNTNPFKLVLDHHLLNSSFDSASKWCWKKRNAGLPPSMWKACWTFWLSWQTWSDNGFWMGYSWPPA